MDLVQLPSSNEGTSRAFVLLDALRRRYWADSAPPYGLLKGVEQLVGYVPKNSLETFRVKNALKRQQRNRKSAERRPRSLPANDKELQWVTMTLGHIARSGRIRPNAIENLENKLGSSPRTKQLAASWQKIAKGVKRRRIRKRLVAENFAVAERKRAARQAKRESLGAGNCSS